MNWMSLTKMLRGISFGLTPLCPRGKRVSSTVLSLSMVVLLLSPFIRTMYTLQWTVLELREIQMIQPLTRQVGRETLELCCGSWCLPAVRE